MNKNVYLSILFTVLLLLFLSTSCTPSKDDLDTTATQIAEEIYTNQTTDVPTNTQNPSDTSVPTDTLVPTPEPTATTKASPTLTLTEILTPTLSTAPTLSSYQYFDLINQSHIQYLDADFEGAIDTYSEILSYSFQDEDKKTVYALRAEAYDAIGDHKAALEDYLVAYELGYESAMMINNICLDFALVGEPEKGLPFCDEAVEKYHSKFRKDRRGIAYALLGNSDAAVEDFQDVVDSLENATGVYANSIFRSRMEWLEALNEGENPFKTELLEELKQQNYLFIAESHIVHENHHAAINLLSKAIEQDPNEINLYHLRGIAYTKIYEPGLAIEDFDMVIESGEKSADIFFIRGTQYGLNGDHDKAITDFDQAISIDPEHGDAYYRRGLAYHSLADYEQAIEDFDKAIEIFPDYADAYRDRGVTLTMDNEFERAVTDFEKAVDLDPEDALSYHYLGWVNMQEQKYDSSIELFSKAIELDPNLIDSLLYRAISYGMMGELENVLNDCDTIIEKVPDYAYAYYLRGSVYSDMNDFQKAISDIENALSLGLTPDQKKDAEELLKQLEESS